MNLIISVDFQSKNNQKMIQLTTNVVMIIGTYIGHKVTFRNVNQAAFDALWSALIAKSVKDSVMIEMADGQTTISYRAYYTSGTRKLTKVHDGVNYWDEIQINFIPISATVTP